MRGTGSGAKAATRLGVLKCNWLSYQVLQSCQLTYAGMSGVCIGVAAQEVTAALDLHAVPHGSRKRVRADVELMAHVAAAEIRRQQDAARKRAER